MNTFGINRPDGYVQGKTEKVAMTENGKLVRADETLDWSAWDALSTQEREAIFADVKSNPSTGWASQTAKKGE